MLYGDEALDKRRVLHDIERHLSILVGDGGTGDGQLIVRVRQGDAQLICPLAQARAHRVALVVGAFNHLELIAPLVR